jgi:SWI/SNF-related matrix-associated actin-dependent regulator of chromatin subfamily A-like protein 1
MKIVEIDKDNVFFESDLRTAMKLGATYVDSRANWKIPITLHSIRELYNLSKDEGVMGLLNRLENYYTQVKLIKTQQDAKGDERLRPYQRVDIAFIKSRQNVGIFNEQRTGKTPTILLSLDDNAKKNLIVCPSGLKLNWHREYRKWIGKNNVAVVSGTPKTREQLYNNFKMLDDFTLIISYETLRNDLERFMRYVKNIDALVVDEAHRLRNYGTKQSKALIKLSKICKYVYPMTGTPAVNHPSDVFGILKLMRPSRYTSYWNFVDRYFTTQEGYFGRQLGGFRKDRASEFQGLLNVVSTQRKRREVMKWLPKIDHRVIELEMTNRQQTLIKEIVELQRYNGNVIPNAIAQLMRLRQATLDPELLGVNDTSPKEQFIYEYIEDNPDEKIIVFSVFTSFLNKLKEKLGDKAKMLTGEQTQAQKQASVDAIQRGNRNILLANIIAGGVGWTLDKVDTIIFTDISYNPIDNQQAQDRFIPTDETKEYGAKQIIKLQMAKSIDKSIDLMVNSKVDIIKYVNDYGINSLVNYEQVEYNIDRKE